MKKYFKPSSLLFYLFTLLIFFIIGTAIASWSGVADNQGLAAAAIVLGYGVLTAAIALVVAIISVRWINPLFLRKINITLVVLLAIAIGILTVRFYNRQSSKESDLKLEKKEVKKPTSTAPVDR